MHYVLSFIVIYVYICFMHAVMYAYRVEMFVYKYKCVSIFGVCVCVCVYVCGLSNRTANHRVDLIDPRLLHEHEIYIYIDINFLV